MPAKKKPSYKPPSGYLTYFKNLLMLRLQCYLIQSLSHGQKYKGKSTKLSKKQLKRKPFPKSFQLTSDLTLRGGGPDQIQNPQQILFMVAPHLHE